MYQVIATLKSQANSQVKAVWIAKEYKLESAARKFVAKQNEINKTYDFRIEQNVKIWGKN
jgi:hypothetical protein